MVYLSLLQRLAVTLAVALWIFVPLVAGYSHATEIGDLDLIAQLDDDSDSADSDSDGLEAIEEDNEDSASDDAESDSVDSDAEEDSDSSAPAA